MNTYLKEGIKFILKPRKANESAKKHNALTHQTYSASILLMIVLKFAFKFIKHENLKCKCTFTFIYEMNAIFWFWFFFVFEFKETNKEVWTNRIVIYA